MDRFTHRDKDGKAYFKPLDPDCGGCTFADERCQHHVDMVAEKMAAYEDAEEQGRLLVLPCKVGDTVYRIFVVPGRNPVIADVKMHNVYDIVMFLNKFGKTVFLTRAEAESALRKEQNHDTDGGMG